MLSDVTQTPRWHPAATEEYWTSDGPIGVGSTRRAVSRSMGIRAENEAVVTAFEPGTALGLRSLDSPIPFEMSIALAEAPGGTEIDWSVRMSGAGWRRPMATVGLSAFMRQLEVGLGNLKRLMEAGEL